MAHGYFRGETTNVQTVTETWLKEHPKAVVVSVSSNGPLKENLPLSKLVFVWVVQEKENLNLELVRKGCFLAKTQMLTPDEKLEVSQADYDTFVQSIIDAEKQAKEQKVGIWREALK
jgi:endonuclease YncB( thermonuclease family)